MLRDDGSTLEIAYRVDAGIRKVSYVLRRTLDREARTIAWRRSGAISAGCAVAGASSHRSTPVRAARPTPRSST